MKSLHITFLLTWLIGVAPIVQAQSVGQPLPIWQEGQLDIHQISTGRGNATFAILPDGTTLLIDAGAVSPLDWQTGLPRNLPIKPDSSRSAGEWIARYIKRCLPFQEKPTIDYALLTHFHDDHMGSPVRVPSNAMGTYRLTGITEVAEHIPIQKIIDRGWPDYAYPRPLTSDSMVVNYRRFLAQQIEKRGLQVERFQAGLVNQIKLLRRPVDYPSFAIRNVAVNGDLWTGEGQATRALFPAVASLPLAQYPTENMCSIALHIRYGAFDYFSGGDLPGVVRFGSPAWHDVETPVATVTGPVDVHLLNHHGHEDSQNGALLAKLQPRVLIIPVWHESHAVRSVLERVFSEDFYTGERTVFATELLEPSRQSLGELTARLTSSAGHVVVRVAPGGETYRVFILDDTDESQRIKSMHGPYRSR